MGIGQFGQAIRDRRRQLELTKREVATRINASTPYIGHLENGRRRPSDEIVERLAGALGFDVDALHLLVRSRRRVFSRDADLGSVWEQFRTDAPLLRFHKISKAEMEMLSRAAMLGEFRSPGDTIHVLDTVRYVIGQ